MKWNLVAGLLTICAVELHSAPPADACGVKLTVKSSAPRKAVARTSNPSDVLLLGTPPRRLEIDLAAAGHRVEVAPRASAAKKKSYAVVVADSSLQNEARSSFGDSPVVVRSGDVTADVRSVEKQVARKPLRADESRTVVAARRSRTPIAVGPTPAPGRRVVAVKEPQETPDPAPVPAPTPPTQPERVATVPRPSPEVKPTEARPTEVTPEPKPKPRPVAKLSPGRNEVYFPYGSHKLSGQATALLAKTVRWLKDSSDVQVVIEGHADPTGNPEDNLTLAQRRAELVRDHLVSAGIDPSRLEVISYGDTRLKYGRTDSRNRRVAIVAK